MMKQQHTDQRGLKEDDYPRVFLRFKLQLRFQWLLVISIVQSVHRKVE